MFARARVCVCVCVCAGAPACVYTYMLAGGTGENHTPCVACTILEVTVCVEPGSVTLAQQESR